MGGEDAEVTQEMMDQAQGKTGLPGSPEWWPANGSPRGSQLNPRLATLQAERARVFIQLQKPKAAIRECDRAIEINLIQLSLASAQGKPSDVWATGKGSPPSWPGLWDDDLRPC